MAQKNRVIQSWAAVGLVHQPNLKFFKLNCIDIKYFIHTSTLVPSFNRMRHYCITLQNNIDRESNWNRNQKAKPQNHDTQKSGFSVKRNVHLFMRTSCRIIRRPTHFLLKQLRRKLVKLTNERIVKIIRVEKNITCALFLLRFKNLCMKAHPP